MAELFRSLHLLKNNQSELHLEEIDIFERNGFIFSGNEKERKQIDRIIDNHHLQLEHKIYKLAQKFRKYDIKIQQSRFDFPNYFKLEEKYYDCREEVFDEIGLPELTQRKGRMLANNLQLEHRIYKLAQKFRKYDIKIQQSRFDFPNYFKLEGKYYDCREEVFDEIGLPELTRREGGMLANDLQKEDFPQIKAVTKPQIGNVVLYLNKREIPIGHWGIVRHISENSGQIYVESKWGQGHVYLHPLHQVPIGYGNKVIFFEKIETLNEGEKVS